MNNIFNKSYSSTPSRLERSENFKLFDSTDNLLEFMINIEDEYFNITKEHISNSYNGIKYNNIEMINEGAEEFKNAAITFFVEIMNKIKELFTKFMMRINVYFSSFDRFVSKYKDVIHKSNPDFFIEGYTYTVLDKIGIPKLDKLYELINVFNYQIENIDELTLSDVQKEKENWDDSENLDKARGYISGFGKPIFDTEYIQTLKSMFRNGDSVKHNVHIDQKVLDEIIDNYSKSKKMSQMLKKEHKDVEKLFKQINKFFEDKAYKTYVDNDKKLVVNKIGVDSNTLKTNSDIYIEYNTENVIKLNKYFNLKFKQAKDISNMILSVYIEKINAFEESIVFYTEVIKRSVFKDYDKDKRGK